MPPLEIPITPKEDKKEIKKNIKNKKNKKDADQDVKADIQPVALVDLSRATLPNIKDMNLFFRKNKGINIKGVPKGAVPASINSYRDKLIASASINDLNEAYKDAMEKEKERKNRNKKRDKNFEENY